MNADLINPFIRSTVDTFKTMLGLSLKKKALLLKKSPELPYDVSAVIGLTGSAKGGVALSFPKVVAQKVVSKLLGEETQLSDAEISDGIAELANILTGAAKTALNEGGMDLNLGLPRVLLGKMDHPNFLPDSSAILVNFECEAGRFAIEVVLD